MAPVSPGGLVADCPLSGPDVAELTGLLCDAFDHGTLEEQVRFTLGDRIYDEYAAPGEPLKRVVFKLLAGLEARGTTSVFLRGVVTARPNRPDVRATIERVCPQSLQSAPPTETLVSGVITGVQAIRRRLDDPVVRRLVRDAREGLERMETDIGVLARYKALHDLLHRVQLKHYRSVADASRRLRTDHSAPELLDEYAAELRVIATDARVTADGLPDVSSMRAQELEWVGELDAVVADLRTARDRTDERAAAEAVRRLKGILRFQPFRVNGLLVITAERLPLNRLLETLDKTAAAVGDGDSLSSDLQAGLIALRRLEPDLMGKVAEHRRWQEIEKDLWQAEENLHQRTAETLDELRFLWQRIKEQVGTLCATAPSERWAIDLDRYAKAFDAGWSALQNAAEPLRAAGDFKRYRHDALHRFYEVDKALNTSCGKIVTIGKPLTDVLHEVRDDR